MTVKVEFHTPEAPDTVVATATWDGTQASVESGDDEVAAKLWRVFRATPVVVDDAAYRRLGTSGEVALQPGSLEWFRAAAQVRAPEAGLVARVVPGVTEGGFDPAAGYRTFDEAMERLVGSGDP
ncbi:MAG TPA: hypothetical protein VGR41_04015 [Actinomycetota bacterium]|nr:hypothetical protein [Actinomycetota bacterium]